ncbi:MAG: hypothetical protein ABSF85_03495 [Terriglobales bacterium]
MPANREIRLIGRTAVLLNQFLPRITSHRPHAPQTICLSGGKLLGCGSNDKKMIEGYQERLSWREIIGSRLAREIILEPKK